MRLKWCQKCQQDKPVDEFFLNPATGRRANSCMEHKRRRTPTYSSAKRYIYNKIATTRRRRPDCTVTADDLMHLLNDQDGLCAVTGLLMTWSPHSPHTNVSLDRIDSGKGYTIDNIRLVCATVNYMKHRMNDEQLLFWCRAVIEGLDARDRRAG